MKNEDFTLIEIEARQHAQDILEILDDWKQHGKELGRKAKQLYDACEEFIYAS